jgi:hypothetical protein
MRRLRRAGRTRRPESQRAVAPGSIDATTSAAESPELPAVSRHRSALLVRGNDVNFTRRRGDTLFGLIDAGDVRMYVRDSVGESRGRWVVEKLCVSLRVGGRIRNLPVFTDVAFELPLEACMLNYLSYVGIDARDARWSAVFRSEDKLEKVIVEHVRAHHKHLRMCLAQGKFAAAARLAILVGDMRAFEAALAGGASPCTQWLVDAVDTSRAAFVRRLRAMAGIDPSVRDAMGLTLLHWAAFYGAPKVVSAVLDYDEVDPLAHAEPMGSALTFAAHENRPAVVRALLGHRRADATWRPMARAALAVATTPEQSDVQKALREWLGSVVAP